jgi:hypothetical protein
MSRFTTRLGGLVAAATLATAAFAVASPAEATTPPGSTVPPEDHETHVTTESTAPPLSDAGVPVGAPITADDLAALQGLFDDSPFAGGQVAPRLSKWITPEAFIFVQFDDLEAPTAVRYVGVGVKGVFCAEAVPDAEGASFTHLHQPEVADYSEGHGGDPGQQGYWLSWLAVDAFETGDGRQVEPGIDYEFSPTPPPECGADVPSAEFTAPDEQTLSAEDLAAFVELFDDEVLIGGQVPPRLSLWLNDEVALFIQLDEREPAEATTINYLGIYRVGTFCDTEQPPDFPHYHRYSAPEYSAGHGGAPGETSGYWLAWIATHNFEAGDGRQVTPGIDREFSPTPPPSC